MALLSCGGNVVWEGQAGNGSADGEGAGPGGSAHAPVLCPPYPPNQTNVCGPCANDAYNDAAKCESQLAVCTVEHAPCDVAAKCLIACDGDAPCCQSCLEAEGPGPEQLIAFYHCLTCVHCPGVCTVGDTPLCDE